MEPANKEKPKTIMRVLETSLAPSTNNYNNKQEGSNNTEGYIQGESEDEEGEEEDNDEEQHLVDGKITKTKTLLTEEERLARHRKELFRKACGFIFFTTLAILVLIAAILSSPWLFKKGTIKNP